MKLKLFKWITGILAVIICMGIVEIPDIYHSYSKHGAYDWGYHTATGIWPDDCSDDACKFHHRGFWEEKFNIGKSKENITIKTYRLKITYNAYKDSFNLYWPQYREAYYVNHDSIKADELYDKLKPWGDSAIVYNDSLTNLLLSLK